MWGLCPICWTGIIWGLVALLWRKGPMVRKAILNAIQKTLAATGELDLAVVSEHCPDERRQEVGKGIQEYQRFQAWQLRTLVGEPMERTEVPWQLQAFWIAYPDGRRVDDGG